MILDMFSLIVIGVLVAVVIWLAVLFGSLPGKIASQRGHPQADAIGVSGWIGLITFGIAWFVALVWAYIRPVGQGHESPELAERVAALEQRMQQAEGEAP